MPLSWNYKLLTEANDSIIFVHGLFGHPYHSWTQRVRREEDHYAPKEPASTFNDTHPPRKKVCRTDDGHRDVFWPRDLLPGEVSEARVLTWGYDVRIERLFAPTSKSSIFDHSESLLHDLVALRYTDEDKAVPIVFIAHSLGGIVVKDAISISKQETGHLGEIFRSIKAVMFLGTPHHGSNVASLGKIAFEISKLFLQKPNVGILRSLEAKSEVLERISKDFGRVLSTSNIAVHSFREELERYGVMVVSSHSAQIGCLNETSSTLHTDHHNLAKFPNATDTNFQRVASVLRRWRDRLRQQHVAESVSGISSSNHDLSDDLSFDNDYQICLHDLGNPEARRRFNDVEPTHCNTYAWLYDQDTGFCDWLEGKESNPIFWIQGKPGSGKSTAMKFALGQNRTQELLFKNSPEEWILAGFFFHDRGSQVQKSLPGFVREILFQLLKQSRALFSLIYPHIRHLFTPGNARQTRKFLHEELTPRHICEILALIENDIPARLNVCIFIDALDEHDGNHRDLLMTIRSLVDLQRNSNFHIRVCLASRPEIIFRAEYGSCPGFAIHERTSNDIGLYVKDRLGAAAGQDWLRDSKNDLESLAKTIIEMAKGVFLWVRLVLDELIERVHAGDTIQELADLVTMLPTELEQLYSRVLTRRRHSAFQVPKKRIEAEGYFMFQMAVAAIEPLDLWHFLCAALWTQTGDNSHLALEKLSLEQMERRLHERSAGLLESTVSSRLFATHKPGGNRIVQFIHQTAKEYFVTGRGAASIEGWVAPAQRESGARMILRYLLHVAKMLHASEVVGGMRYVFFKDVLIENHDARFVSDNFEAYAPIVELYERMPVACLVEGIYDICPEKPGHPAFKNLAISVTDVSTPAIWQDDNPLHAMLVMLLFYAREGLHLSVAHYITKFPIQPEGFDSYMLLLSTVSAWDGSRETLLCLRELLKAGFHKNLSQKQLKFIRDNFCQVRYSGHVFRSDLSAECDWILQKLATGPESTVSPGLLQADDENDENYQKSIINAEPSQGQTP